jgi:murein DD-endopeptidase MepM/ murein hydrolase activator NlpD
MRLRAALLAGVTAILPLPSGAAAGPAEATTVAGLLRMDEALLARWGWSGAWLFPVGDPGDYERSAGHGIPPFRVNRGIERGERGGPAHQGADLANGRGGDPVRAAAQGVVVLAQPTGWNGGFGRDIVIAHRMVDGALAYSVYAHLAPGSVAVRAGEMVGAGQPLARVGRSGRATTEHLHFEVRLAGDPAERWENARAVDPVAFVAARLPGARADTSRDAPYLLWAECAALTDAEDRADGVLTRAAWWRMLARSARHPIDAPPEEPAALRERLIEAAVLPEGEDPAASDPLPWAEFARDLERLRHIGVRLAPWPGRAADHRAACERRFALASPGRDLERIARRSGPGPRVADACLLLADLCVPRKASPPPGTKRAPRGPKGAS